MSIAEKLTSIAENQKKVYDAGIYDAGYEKGYEAGANSVDSREAFWETFQQGGERLDYTGAFSGGWLPSSMFPPMYDMYPTSAVRMFYNAAYTGKLEDLLGGKKLVLNTEYDVSAERCFMGSDFSSIGTIDLRGTDASHSYMFASMSNLTTIEMFYPPNACYGCLGWSAFNNCVKLANLTIGSEITEPLNFQWSPLTHDSLMSIINHLEDWDVLCDYYDDPLVLILGGENIAKLSDEELYQIEAKGWTYK